MKEFFAVRKGRIPGVYSTWKECEAQTAGYRGAECKKFMFESQAFAYVKKLPSTGRYKCKALEKTQTCIDDFMESLTLAKQMSENARLSKQLQNVSEYANELYDAAYDMQLEIVELRKKVETLEAHIEQIEFNDTIIG